MEDVTDCTAWMGAFLRLRIADLVLPGTHNSGSFDTSFSHPCPPVPLLPPLGLLKRWCVCQEATIDQQLHWGVRCFDLRVGRTRGGEWWLVHMFSLVPLEQCVADMRRFLARFETERIVVRCRVGWEQRDHLSSEDLFHHMRALFEEILIEDAGVPMGLMRAEERVLLLVDGYTIVSFEGHWSNTADPARLAEDATARVFGPASASVFREASFVLTPALADIKRSLWSRHRGVAQLADEANAILLQLLNRGIRPSNCNVISVDFADALLVQRIVYFNYL
jgi:hypothetical protein